MNDQPEVNNSYHQTGGPYSAFAQGPHSQAVVHNYGVEGPAYWVQRYEPSEPPSLAELRLLRDQPSKLLIAHRKVIPFTGREQLCGDLAAWRDNTEVRRAAWFIHAPGGQGKTRLADHFAAQSTLAGWAVGLVRHRNESPTPGPTTLTRSPDTRLLLIVDYAERWPSPHLRKFVKEWIAHPVAFVRVLFLARSTSWWATISADLDSLPGAVVTATTAELPPLARNGEERRQLLRQARDRYADIYGIEDATVVDVDNLTSGNQILSIHMATLAAVDAYCHGNKPPSKPQDVSRYLLYREQVYWEALYKNKLTSKAIARTVFVAALTGAMTNSAATTLLNDLGLPRIHGLAAQSIIDDHLRCYPPTDPATVCEPLYPDRLAEDFIALTLADHSEPLADTWAADLITCTDDNHLKPGLLFRRNNDAPPRYTTRALTFLSAAASRWPHVLPRLLDLLKIDPKLAVDAGSPALIAVAPLTDLSLAKELHRLLPEYSNADLDAGAVVLTEHLADLLLPEATDPTHKVNILDELGRRYHFAGRHADALSPAQQVVEIYRELAASNPNRHLPALAGSLRNLGALLASLDHATEALTPALQASAIYAKLTSANSEDYAPEFASSLHNLAVIHSDLGRYDDALKLNQIVVDLRRSLAKTYPDKYLAELAASLTNLGSSLLKLGRYIEAVTNAEEAVDIYRKLATQNQSEHEGTLAAALNNLGSCLHLVDRYNEAFITTQEAVAIRRELATKNPEKHLPDLASSLSSLSNYSATLGRYIEAVANAEEAVDIYRKLATQDHNQYAINFANSLDNLGALYFTIGRHDDAIACAKEAVVGYRNLINDGSDKSLPGLASALDNLGSYYFASHQHNEALTASQEAITIYRKLVTDNDKHLPDLAAALNLLSKCLAHLGRHDEALAPAEEAVTIQRQLASVNGDDQLPHLASSLHDLGIRLSILGRHSEALTATQETVAILRRLVSSSEKYRPELASSLRAFALVRAASKQQLDEGLVALKEALTIYGELAKHEPEKYTELIEHTYLNLMSLLEAAGRRMKRCKFGG